MSTKETRHYVVWKGVRPGIYKSWREASEQVNGYSGAQFERFGCLEDADVAFRSRDTVCSEAVGQSLATLALSEDVPPPDLFGLAVDASCSGAPAAALLKYAARADVTIYSDSLTALGWVRARTCGTQLKLNARKRPDYSNSSIVLFHG